MPTQAKQVLDRAVARNVANRGGSLTQSTPEMLHVIGSANVELRTAVINANRTFYQHQAELNSSGGSIPRLIDWSALNPPVFRVLKLSLRDSEQTEISIVDLRDVEAELAPRCYPRGKTFYEVGHDWGSGTAVIPVYIWYDKGVRVLDVNGHYDQLVDIEDEYAWLLDNRLGRYLSEKDTGRDPQEVADLDDEYQLGMENYLAYLSGIAGPLADRFFLPKVKAKE